VKSRAHLGESQRELERAGAIGTRTRETGAHPEIAKARAKAARLLAKAR
jgi:hypothetical protein